MKFDAQYIICIVEGLPWYQWLLEHIPDNWAVLRFWYFAAHLLQLSELLPSGAGTTYSYHRTSLTGSHAGPLNLIRVVFVVSAAPAYLGTVFLVSL